MTTLLLFVTYVTLLLAPGHAPITLSETYWDEAACQARVPDVIVLFGAMLDETGATVLDAAACRPVDESKTLPDESGADPDLA